MTDLVGLYFIFALGHWRTGLASNDDLAAGCQELVGHFLADTRQIGNGVVAVLGLVVVLACLDEDVQQVCVVLFVDGEVGDGCFHLQSCCRCDGAAADVDLDAHVIDLSHIADLLGLGDAAGVAQVGLDHGQGAVLEELTEAPAGVAALAGCQRQVALLFDVAEVAGILGAGGLLEVHDVQRLQSLAQLSSGVGIQQRVDLYDDVQVRTASLTAGSDTLDRALQVVLTVAAADLSALAAPDLLQRSVGIGSGKDGIDLDGIIAVADSVLGHFIVIFRVEQQAESLALVIFLDQVAPAELQLRSVCAELRIGLAAQQLVDGNAEGFALDIPAGGMRKVRMFCSKLFKIIL